MVKGMSYGFFGQYEHAIDSKGRMFMPSRFREDLGEHFFVTIGFDKECLYVFPAEEYMRLKAKLDSVPLANKDMRGFIRFFFGNTYECETDKQGRLMVPQTLRDLIGLGDMVTVVGSSNRIELWNPTAWKDGYSLDSFSADEIFEKMEFLGI